ncbi:MAG: hypothetical protein ACNS62_21950 [Candidatus Cyclobacteriaceae bacterium M3_2C_046]
MKNVYLISWLLLILNLSCKEQPAAVNQTSSAVYHNEPYWQDFSIKYYLQDQSRLIKVFADRNGVVKVLSDQGLLGLVEGQMLQPGQLTPDHSYRPLRDKNILDLTIFQEQFFYADDEAIFSNALAGSKLIPHYLENARVFSLGQNFDFLISDGSILRYGSENQEYRDEAIREGRILDIEYDEAIGSFWILMDNSIYQFDPDQQELDQVYTGAELTTFVVADEELVIGTGNGYFRVDKSSGQPGDLQVKVPSPEITAMELIEDELWFGSAQGAFKLNQDGSFNYYFGERWLPGNQVLDIAPGPERSVLILTDAGLGQIMFQKMTLAEKAEFFDKQVRQRHIRYGFNASLGDMEKGNVYTGQLKDSDNDGLWTCMYLASQIFRYAVTESPEAQQNCRESLQAMERLYDINPVPGFPSRSFERSGYIPELADPERWQHAADPKWDWKATTSSDEAIGHMFVFAVMADLIDDPEFKGKAIQLIDTLMGHILDNDLYLVDYNGEPTTWGRWNPEYVNARPVMVGDRKLNSSNIISMLQTAYHFTGKEKYREKAFELMRDHGYLENLMRPMEEIGRAPAEADALSRDLSSGWNHSDDEMYFLGYWGLYHYAFNDSLKSLYKQAILDHWQMERPEREGLWNIMTAMTGVDEFDLDEAIWYLKEHPLDLIDWDIKNSHRKDLEFMQPNFRNQTIRQVLPPDERPIQRHNSNMFTLDQVRNNGRSEHSAGDIWLFPYWMGRYLGVIQEPKN